jgi:asparagine synthase (glutamine-hydrolysing)
MLPEAVRAADEPLADLTTVPLLALSRFAREKVKVVLSGEGADEVLAGYNFDVVSRRFAAIQRIQSLPSSVLRPLSSALALFSDGYAARFSRTLTTPLSKWNTVNRNHITYIFKEVEKAALWPAFAGQDSGTILSGMYEASESQRPLDQILYVYQQSWLVEDLLMKADKMSMAASLELRQPFMDYRLVEWANRQPSGVKVGDALWGNVTKNVLRRFAATRLPRSIISRPKQGFPIPVNRWLAEDEFSRWTRELLTGKRARLRRLFNPHEIVKQIDRAARGDHAAAPKTWLLIVLETWLREYNVEIDESEGLYASSLVSA